MLWKQPASSFYVLLVEAVFLLMNMVRSTAPVPRFTAVAALQLKERGIPFIDFFFVRCALSIHIARTELCKGAHSVALSWKSCPEVTANHRTSGAEEVLPLHIWSLNTHCWCLSFDLQRPCNGK